VGDLLSSVTVSRFHPLWCVLAVVHAVFFVVCAGALDKAKPGARTRWWTYVDVVALSFPLSLSLSFLGVELFEDARRSRISCFREHKLPPKEKQ
jgi:hypothetical protein